MKLYLSTFIILLLLSSPLFGDYHKGKILYKGKTSSGEQWMGFGEKDSHPKYNGQVENGKLSGFGVMYFPNGNMYLGKSKDGKRNGQGTYTFTDGRKHVGEWKEGKPWNGTEYENNGEIRGKVVNGK